MSKLNKEKKLLRKMYDNLCRLESEADEYDCGRKLLAEFKPDLINNIEKQYKEMNKQLALCKSLEI